MLKINVGLSRKLSQDFNSHGFTLNIEGELPSDVLHDEKVLSQSTSRLFQLANLMLDEQVRKASTAQPEVTKTAAPATDRNKPQHTNRFRQNGNVATNGHNGNGQAHTNGNNGRSTDTQTRLLTQAQARAITNMARKLNEDADQWARDEFGVNEVKELDLKQASEAIDLLRQRIEGDRNGGGR